MPKNLVFVHDQDEVIKFFLDGRPRKLNTAPKKRAYGARVVPDIPDTEAAYWGWPVYDGPIDARYDWNDVGETDPGEAVAYLWEHLDDEQKAAFVEAHREELEALLGTPVEVVDEEEDEQEDEQEAEVPVEAAGEWPTQQDVIDLLAGAGNNAARLRGLAKTLGIDVSGILGAGSSKRIAETIGSRWDIEE